MVTTEDALQTQMRITEDNMKQGIVDLLQSMSSMCGDQSKDGKWLLACSRVVLDMDSLDVASVAYLLNNKFLKGR